MKKSLALALPIFLLGCVNTSTIPQMSNSRLCDGFTKKYTADFSVSPELYRAASNELDKRNGSCLSNGTFVYKSTAQGSSASTAAKTSSQVQPAKVQPVAPRPKTQSNEINYDLVFRGLEMMTGQTSYGTSSRAETCHKVGDGASGLYRTCVYSCIGGRVSQTINVTEICPLTIRR
jgi:hypothetical protein